MTTLCECGHYEKQHNEGVCDYNGYSCVCYGYKKKAPIPIVRTEKQLIEQVIEACAMRCERLKKQLLYTSPASPDVILNTAADALRSLDRSQFDEPAAPPLSSPRGGEMIDAKELLQDFRDCILNQRGALAENGMTNDQVNDVLGEFDDRFAALLSQREELGRLKEANDHRHNRIAQLKQQLKSAESRREKREGMVMVPREPTVVQVNAGVDADDLRTGFETVKHIYRAMIAVTPFEEKTKEEA